MLRPEIELNVGDIYRATGNQFDDISSQCRRFWIAEAIRYTHKKAIDTIFASNTSAVNYPQFPTVERLQPRRTPHFGLGPILENEGTIQGTYQVIDTIFLRQLGLDSADINFKERLYLVYGDQKTVSLIGSVKRERKDSRDDYGRYRWLLPIPGLFHWRTNLMDMIYDVYGGYRGSEPGYPTVKSSLLHNQNYMGYVQGQKSPFHHKEEVATRAFDARITAMFYQRIQDHCMVNDRENINQYIADLSPSAFLEHVEAIQAMVFDREVQWASGEGIDQEFVAHCRFIHQMETYKSLKYAIKHADIGIIERTFARCCLLFHGSKKKNYAFLSLYMTWLTQTEASNPALRTAILANGLVNLRGTADGWFEMDRLNEFFNLQMKTLMATRRTSTQSPDALFRRVALTASYCSDLKAELDQLTGSFTNGRHQTKDASEDVYRLAYELYKTGSVRKHSSGRESDFQPADIVSLGTGDILYECVVKFNSSQLADEYIDPAPVPPIAELDELVDDDSEGSSV